MMNKLLKILMWTGICALGSVLLAVVYYCIFALFFSTDVEQELIRENRLYSSEIPRAQEEAGMLEEELRFLQERDENIYKQVFKAELPHVDDMLEGRPDDAVAVAGKIEENWEYVLNTVSRNGYTFPPMVLPLDNLNYTNVGASVGDKLNPFYGVKAHHEGIDLVAPEGSEVHATASGYVTDVKSSLGGKGNMVEITHAGGYVTRYAHLLSVSVKKNEYVKVGRTIGLVGDSGRAFTTHLHYEILYKGQVMDPVDFFFGSLTPTEYTNFLIMSVSSGQSMD